MFAAGLGLPFIETSPELASEIVLVGEGCEIDGPPDGRAVVRRPSAGPSNRQSIPCCFLRRSKFSLRASMSSFDLTIFSG